MRKIILSFLVLLIFNIPETKACDICGCGIGGNYMGILPQFNKNFVGVRYKNRTFKHQGNPLSYNGDSKVLHDNFQTAELWARFFPKPRWQFMVFAPISMHQRVESNYTEQISGIGDIFGLANYLLINTGDSLFQKTKITWMIGGGMQLPTGKYQQRSRNQTLFPHAFQIGSGAWAFSANTLFMMRRKKWGFNADATYRYNLKNELEYQFGQQFVTSLNTFHWAEFKNQSLLTNVGFIFENFNADKEYGARKSITGGSNVLMSTGMDLYLKSMVIGAHYFHPLWNQLPDAMPVNTSRWMIQLTFLY
jgi:hypothetical protein